MKRKKAEGREKTFRGLSPPSSSLSSHHAHNNALGCRDPEQPLALGCNGRLGARLDPHYPKIADAWMQQMVTDFGTDLWWWQLDGYFNNNIMGEAASAYHAMSSIA